MGRSNPTSNKLSFFFFKYNVRKIFNKKTELKSISRTMRIFEKNDLKVPVNILTNVQEVHNHGTRNNTGANFFFFLLKALPARDHISIT